MQKFSQIFILFLISGLCFAQVSVKLQQPPPNQLRASDIWKLTLVNSSKNTLVITINGTLEENEEGELAHGNSKPMRLPPGTKKVTYEDVKSGNINFKSGRWNDAFTRTGNAPSGDYTICISVKNESGDEIGRDCINQRVEILSAPTLISPMNGDPAPEQPIFTWISPMPMPSGQIIYKLKIVEIIGKQSPQVAMQSNMAWFEKSDIRSTSFQYPLSAKKCEVGKNYAWQISANINNTFFPSDEVGSFKVESNNFTLKSLPIGSDSTASTGNPVPPVSTCTSAPPAVVITNQTPSTKSASAFVQQVVKVGLFNMKVLTATGNSSALTGTGSILVAWLKTPVAVEFKNIKINTVDEVYNGDVITQFDPSPDTWPQQWLINGGGSANWTVAKVKKLDGWLHNSISGYPTANKLVKNFDMAQMVQNYTDTPLKFPLGINNADGYTIAISEMKFEPTTAKLNCLAIFPVNEYNDSVGFKGSEIVFSTGGPSAQSGKLGLIDDATFIGNVPNGDSYTVVIKKEQGTADGTFISWDCEGFRELNIDMDVLFPRSWLKPIPDNGTNKTKCNIITNIVKWDDWVIEANLPKSTISGTQGMELEVNSFFYDHSSIRNPDSLSFPSNYPTGATTGLDFTGFFIKHAKIKLPTNFKTSNNPVTIDIDNMIINKQGLTCKIIAKDIYTFPNGNIAGLGATLDTIKLEMVCSSLTNAYMRGKIVLPVSEMTAANSLPYKASFTAGSGFQFSIHPQGPITAKFFSDAKFTLDATSTISFSISDSSKFDINLSGNFDWPDVNIANVKNVKMQMTFQNLGISYLDSSNNSNKFTFRKGNWSFASPQKFLANFPVSIKYFSFGMKPKQGTEVARAGLSFSVIVNLDDKIGGTSAFTVIGAISKDPVTGKFTPTFVGVNVDTIKIFANLSAVKLDGKIVFYSNHPIYGSGFLGTIKATITSIKTEISSTLRMGSTDYNSIGNFYRYWYVDAKVILPKTSGIPFLSGLAFYGFGVGVWHKMTAGALPPMNLASVENATSITNATTSGTVFTPDKSTGLGLSIMAVIGTYPEPKAFNSDATLIGEFNNTTGGLNLIRFNFDFWCLAELTKRSDATILGNAVVTYVPPTKQFSLAASALINKPPITTVGIGNPSDRVNLALSIDGKHNKWFFICGTPKPNQTNKVKVGPVVAWEYLLVGNDIAQFVVNGFQPSTIVGLNSVGVSLSGSATTVPSESATGKGFAFGVGVTFNTDKSQSILSLPRGDVLLKYGAGGGFEVNLSLLQYSQNTICGTTSPIGFRNWYAQGGVAAWFNGYVNVWIPKKSGLCLICCGSSGYCIVPFASMTLGFGVQAGFPNPLWVTGSGKVTVDIAGFLHWSQFVDLSYGTPCTPQPLPSNQNYTQEDATQQVGDMIICIETPPSPERFEPGKKICAMLGFTPNAVFDIQERQANGTMLNRSFQVRYFPTLVDLGPAPMNQSTSGGTYQNYQTLSSYTISLGGGNLTNSNPTFTLVRSSLTNSYGQYEFFKSNQLLTVPYRNLSDTTYYKFILRAELWRIKAGTVNTWEQAKSNIGNNIIETRTAYFNTGILPPQTNNQTH